MDKEAVFNRCLLDATGLATNQCETVGDVACYRRVRVPYADTLYRQVSVLGIPVRVPYESPLQGYQWLARHLRQADFSRPSTADFKGYATRWEGRYSAIIPDRTGHLTLVPVVDDTPFLSREFIGIKMSLFPVIMHHGTVHVTNIIVPRRFATSAVGVDRIKALEQLLNQGIEAYVEEGYPAAGDWGSFAQSNNVGPNLFTVLTDPEGRILASLDASGSEPGLESEDPLSYLLPAVDVLKLATKGGRLVFRMVSRRAAAKAEAKLAAAELGAMAGPKAAAKSAFWRAGEITPRTFTAAETKALTDKIARRMKQLGIPEKNIGIRNFPGESGEAFTASGTSRGLRVRGRGISVHGSVAMDWAGFPEWNAATVDTRIDAIIAHEWMEFNELSHWETVELVTESKLPITKEAKELLSAMQKQGEGWKALEDKTRPR